MGAHSIGYKQIILLEGIDFEEIQYNEGFGYKFKQVLDFSIKNLEPDEIKEFVKLN